MGFGELKNKIQQLKRIDLSCGFDLSLESDSNDKGEYVRWLDIEPIIKSLGEIGDVDRVVADIMEETEETLEYYVNEWMDSSYKDKMKALHDTKEEMIKKYK